MNIYRVFPNTDKFRFFVPSSDKLWQCFLSLDGTPMTNRWIDPCMKEVLVSDSTGEPLVKADFESILPFCPAVHSSVVDALTKCVSSEVELLGMSGDASHYFCMNVVNVLDALDTDLSSIVYFPGTKRIMDITSYAFKYDVISDSRLFRLTSAPKLVLLATDKFTSMYFDSGMKGLAFSKLV